MSRFEIGHRAGDVPADEANGWSLKRINGSHHIYSKAGQRKVISVPVHGNKDLKAGLALRIARDAGIDISTASWHQDQQRRQISPGPQSRRCALRFSVWIRSNGLLKHTSASWSRSRRSFTEFWTT